MPKCVGVGSDSLVQGVAESSLVVVVKDPVQLSDASNFAGSRTQDVVVVKVQTAQKAKDCETLPPGCPVKTMKHWHGGHAYL